MTTRSFERHLSEIQRTLAQGLRTMALQPGDLWHQVADAVERYSNSSARYSDFLRVKSHRADILNNDFLVADEGDRAIIVAWVNQLKEPTGVD